MHIEAHVTSCHGTTKELHGCLHCLPCFHRHKEVKGLECRRCRVSGSTAFRNQLLARYGTVLAIPYHPDISTAESMAGDIKAAVEAKTGLPLDSFRS